ncbi:ABC transporter substrate-binding protein [Aminobacterium mobile]|uniref:ABC transporter substrate-binding protein n=1 Tax=Aminobacterium mobile TaxID=81467 RepID=UPI00331639F8
MKKNLLKKTILIGICMLIILSAETLPLRAAEEKVTFIDFSWDSVQIHNRIAGYIITHGYGRETDYMFAESLPGLLGIERGDAQIIMELWADNVHEWWQKAQEKGKVISLGENFPNAPQGWYVPTYVIKGDQARKLLPVAPHLKSVKDLPKYWKLFKDLEEPSKGRFYNGPAGWKVHSINLDKLKAYNLYKTYEAFDPGSQTALASVIASAYEKGEPVLAYYWEPTAIMGKYSMTKLEEPPYNKKTWETTRKCAFPSAKVLILANSQFALSNPDIAEFLKRYQTTIDQNNKALAYMRDTNSTVMETAIWFLKTYSRVWKEWVQDEVIIKKIETALEKGDILG